MYIYMCVFTCVYIYTYIYSYIHTCICSVDTFVVAVVATRQTTDKLGLRLQCIYIPEYI